MKNKFLMCSVLFVMLVTSVTHSQNVLAALQQATRNIATEVLPVVVTVDVSTTVEISNGRGFFFKNPFDFFGKGDKDDEEDPNDDNNLRKFKRKGQGSGVIVQRDKNTYYALTNAHVVEDADTIVLIMHDEREVSAKLVGKDAGRDLALVSFKSDIPVAVAKIGDSDDVYQGDLVFVVGSPYGLRSSIAFGIVSAVGRTGGTSERGMLTEYIQTDAAVNKGNSGGPLLNINGEVIGINSWIYSHTGDNIGLSFAVPINNALPVVESFIKTGAVSYGWLGVLQQGVRTAMMPSLTDDNFGAFVSSIIKGSPAEKANIQPGDIIKKVNDTAIKDPNDLVKAIASSKPGSRISITVLRNGQDEKLSVILGKRIIKSSGKEMVWPGFSVVEITPDIRKQFDISSKKGVLVNSLHPNSSARIAGLRTGDIVERINNESVNDLKEFYRELQKNSSTKKEILFRINRNGTVVIIGLVSTIGN